MKFSSKKAIFKVNLRLKMSGVAHKGQIQVVEGSPSGDFHVKTLLGYNPEGRLIYDGVQKIGTTENENRCYIERLDYNAQWKLTGTSIAQNLTSIGCTNVTLKKLSSKTIEITPNNGVGLGEINKGDGFTLTTTLNQISGIVLKKVGNSLHIEMNSEVVVTDETTAINEFDLEIRLENELTKDYAKRRWANRATYKYA